MSITFYCSLEKSNNSNLRGLFCSPTSSPNPKRLLHNHKKCKIKPSVCFCFKRTLYLMWPCEATPPSRRRSPSPRPPKPSTGDVTHSTAVGSAATLQRMRPTPGGGSTWEEHTPSSLSKSPTEVTAAPRDWMERRLESGTRRRTMETTTPGADQNLSQTFLQRLILRVQIHSITFQPLPPLPPLSGVPSSLTSEQVKPTHSTVTAAAWTAAL